MLSKHPTAFNYNLQTFEQVNTSSAPLGKGIGKIIVQRFLRPGVKIGEILISGPNTMKGYCNKPKETAEAIVFENRRPWLRTGGIGYVDARGCLYIVDRMKVSFI
jgi:long-subunit acyl-CoA synthetase (AMP-forming)